MVLLPMDAKLKKVHYSSKGYRKGFEAIKHLATAAKVFEDVARAWLKKQAIWQIYLPAPRHVPRPKFNIIVPNEVHQADLLFLPHDRQGRGRKLYKYALTIVDIASRFKEAEPLATKEAKEVAYALERIYSRSPLTWPKLLQVDPGREFMGKVNTLLAKHNTKIRRGRVNTHRDQGIVERWNRTLAERLFGHQYAQEMLLPEGKKSTEWVKRLPSVVKALNGEVTRLTGLRPKDAIKAKTVAQKPSSVIPGRPIGFEERKVPSGINVRYLYQPGELEGGMRRATDPIWSMSVHRIVQSIKQKVRPVLYYISDGPKRSFVQELQVVPPDTQLPVSTS